MPFLDPEAFNSRFYRLEGRTPVPCDIYDLSFNEKGRQVAIDQVKGSRVSTVLLSIDTSFGFGPPQLFETMIFNGSWGVNRFLDRRIWRYATWEEAEIGHALAVKYVKDCNPNLLVRWGYQLYEAWKRRFDNRKGFC